MKADFHMHTLFSDGANTPEEMVQQAIALGMECIGISDHSYTAFDESYCLGKNEANAYRNTIQALKEKYEGKIRILCGIEQEYYSAAAPEGYDYAIGSLHYLKLGGRYLPLDESPAIFEQIVRDYFGGDALALTQCYYETLADVVNKTQCDIIGHFDLVSLFNKDNRLFDESDSRYCAAYRKAADYLCTFRKPFEINTRAFYRGKRDVPYPAPAIADYIAQKGGNFILSSDAHSTSQIMRAFDIAEKSAQQKKYTLVSL